MPSSSAKRPCRGCKISPKDKKTVEKMGALLNV